MDRRLKILANHYEMALSCGHLVKYISLSTGTMVDQIKDAANILFFVTTSTIAVLSFLQARKTLFSPIRTEIFKLQIESFREVVSFFNRAGQSSFDDIFEFHKTFRINVERMYRAYAGTFFSDDIAFDKPICDNKDNAPCLMIINHEDLTTVAESNLSSCCPLGGEGEPIPEIKDPALKLAYWQRYTLRGVHYTSNCGAEIERVRLLATHPVLPEELSKLIYLFIEDVQYNISLMKNIIEKCALDMTERYPTTDDALAFQSDWIWNEFNDERRNLDDAAKAILTSVKSQNRGVDALRKVMRIDGMEQTQFQFRGHPIPGDLILEPQLR